MIVCAGCGAGPGDTDGFERVADGAALNAHGAAGHGHLQEARATHRPHRHHARRTPAGRPSSGTAFRRISAR